MAQDLVQTLADLKEDEALNIVQKRLDSGENALDILADTRRAMEIVGKRFADENYFIPDLVFAGEILKKITALVSPGITTAKEAEKGEKVVFGTVEGDIHDIGKDIVVFMLINHGFDVYDLGVDVLPDKFVDKVKETNAKIIGLSGFLTLSYDSMKQTVDAIKGAGLRDKVKIMIGGAQFDDEVRQYTGADAYGPDAMAAVSLATQWSQR